ncbi:MAG: M67 family metallopeptidase [Alphaproteobacteria bacterium]|jgi:proteasome lid subunit RPN8/RPN11|nr:M67 family metallopeptidase [Alphaproteobacteria bacterium]MDP6566619.1 M67 family metallopeptidase [Alphaproteobacteria bacterium]MDP6815047.1 M67 family metallopeptidase [Alphaproteobacteria bacterium]
MIVLAAAERGAIARHVAAGYPDEACGLLLGEGAANGAVVIRQVVPSDNLADDPRHSFEVDPALRLRLQRQSRDGGDRLIGHYHSHPDGPARPSARDAGRIYEPELLWLIAAVRADGLAELAAFMPAAGGGFTELTLGD